MEERNNWDRRDFLKTSAVAGVAAAIFGAHVPRSLASSPPLPLYGRGGLTSAAIIADASLLARHAQTIDGDFRELLRQDVNHVLPGNVAFIGDLAPLSPRKSVELLRTLRAGWTARTDDGRLEEKLALVLGWLISAGARRHLAPLHANAEEALPGRNPSQVTLYHDATVLKARSDKARSSKPIHDQAGEQEPVERLFREIGPRMFLRFHTLIPDFDDGEGWFARLAAWRNEHDVLMNRLAVAYQRPDAESAQRYVDEPNFFDEDDAVIRVAGALGSGLEPAMSSEDAVGATSSDASLYAQALASGFRSVQAVSRFFGSELTESELLERIT